MWCTSVGEGGEPAGGTKAPFVATTAPGGEREHSTDESRVVVC